MDKQLSYDTRKSCTVKFESCSELKETGKHGNRHPLVDCVRELLSGEEQLRCLTGKWNFPINA